MKAEIAKLTTMKERVDEAMTNTNQLKGKKQGFMDTLSNKFEASTYKAAEKTLAGITEKADTDEHAFKEGVEKLGENYNWD